MEVSEVSVSPIMFMYIFVISTCEFAGIELKIFVSFFVSVPLRFILT